MTEWIEDLAALARAGESAVFVTVSAVRGSAPRETGAHMIVTPTETIGSIGGGQLEYQCTALAVEMLVAETLLADRRRFSLGANCGQCCGGVVEVLFDLLPGSRADWLDLLVAAWQGRRPAVVASMTDDGRKRVIEQPADAGSLPRAAAARAIEMLRSGGDAVVVDNWLLEPIRQSGIDVAVFGAGHVGTATVDLLSRLDCNIRWIDNRRGIFPGQVPGNVMLAGTADPVREVAAMPPDSYYLVMTHSHPVDLEICARILRRTDVAWCGLIGSVSKRRRFERLLKKQDIPDQAIARLECPVGVSGIDSKKPVEIAFSIVAAILRMRDRRTVSGRRDPYLEVAG